MHVFFEPFHLNNKTRIIHNDLATFIITRENEIGSLLSERNELPNGLQAFLKTG